MGLVSIINQWALDCRARGPQFKPQRPLDFILFSFFYFLPLTKKKKKKKKDRNIIENPC